MKKILIAIVLLNICCAAPTTITTQQGKTAYTADQIAVQVGHLEQAVIAANQATPKGIPDAAAITIVKFCVNAENTLAATPSGWYLTIQAAWVQVKEDIGSTITSNPVIVSLVSAVDVALGVVQ